MDGFDSKLHSKILAGQDLKNGTTSVKQCEKFQTVLDDFGYNGKALLNRLMEDYVSCAGYCRKRDFFSFSSLQKGQARDRCTDKIQKEIDEFSPIVGAISLLLALILTGGILGSCLIIRNPPFVIDELEDYDESEDIPGQFTEEQMNMFKRKESWVSKRLRNSSLFKKKKKKSESKEQPLP